METEEEEMEVEKRQRMWRRRRRKTLQFTNSVLSSVVARDSVACV